MIRVSDFLVDQTVLRKPDVSPTPVVSVVLPTFARLESGGLARAVSSVLTQTFDALELIVVDDGSTDGTFDFLCQAQDTDDRLVVVRHERNSGLPALRVNEGIELARGRYVAFQFDDDVWLPGALTALVGAASGEKVVTFGAAEVELASGERRVPLPPVPLDEALLSFQNRVANNTVLVPREAFDRVGMYDCHVAMRRLCDWDLWLRLVRHVPFRPVPETVSVVTLRYDARAISLSVPWDLVAFRFHHAIPRDEALTPAHWREYVVDSPAPLGVALPRKLRNRLDEEQLVPFRRRLAAAGFAVAALEEPMVGFSATPKTLLWSSDAFYPPWAYFLSIYDRQSASRGGFKSFYQPLVQLEGTWTEDADVLLLVRSTTDPGSTAVDRAMAEGVPVGYFLDDDFLHLHEQEPAWARMAPGTRDRESFLDQVHRADAVWTNPYLANLISWLNPRSVPHNAAVESRMLPSRLRPRPQDGRIRIGYVGGGYRREEFDLLWPVLARIAREFPGRVCFDFWGLDTAPFAPLPAPLSSRPFRDSMAAFLEDLREAQFDILLTPLLDHPAPRLAKTASKYQLTAVAGALGIYSDVPPYASLPEGTSCLRAANDPESWYGSLKRALTMPAASFDGMRRASVEHVRLEYTTEALVELHEAACRAIEFHAKTRALRGEDGRPRLRVVPANHDDHLPSSELAALLERYGIAAVVEGISASDAERELVALVHRRREGGGPSTKPDRGKPALLVEEPLTGVGRLIPEEIFARGLGRILHLWSGTGKNRAGLEESYALLIAPSKSAGRKLERQLTPHLETGGVKLRVRSAPSRDEVTGALFCVGREASLSRPGPRAWSAAAAVPWIEFSPDEGTGQWSGLVEEIDARLNEAPEARALRASAAYAAVRDELHPDAVANRLLAAYNDLLAHPPVTAFAHPATRVSVDTRTVPSRENRTNRAAEGVGDRLRHHADRLGFYRPLSRARWSLSRRRVLVAYDNPTVSTELYYRLIHRDLEEATKRSWVIRASEEVCPEDLYSFHAVILQRAVSERSLALLAAARREGCKTVYDADDNLLLIDQMSDDPNTPWRIYFGEARERIARLLSGVDQVKVYSSSAVPFFVPHNRNVVPIRPFHLVPEGDPIPGGGARPVRVGFFGSYYKDAEFEPLVPVIRELIEGDYPLAFEFFGFCPEALADDPRVTRLAWEPDYGQFRARLLERRWEIGRAPLRETDFNRCKTNIKYREYAASGIAGIYSRAEIYRTSVEDRRTGLLVPQESSAAWREAILELAENPMLRRWLARNALADLRANYRREEYVAAVAALVG